MHENVFNIFSVLGIGLFALAYVFIALEDKFHINKSGVAIALGPFLWLLAVLMTGDGKEVSESLLHDSQEIFSIVVFLLSAMTIVEMMIHFGLFDWVQEKIMEKKLSSAQLFWILGIVTFFLSGVLDNLTTTLIMIQIGRKIYSHKKSFLIFVAATVIAANAGGAPSPLGDVTTIMIWLAGKASAGELLTLGMIPAFVTFAVPHYLLSRKITQHEKAERPMPIKGKTANPDWTMIAIGFGSFAMPVIFSIIGLPPFLGLLLGLGVVWIVNDYKAKKGSEHHKNGDIINMLEKADVSTLMFFIGILLAVGAIAHMGILDYLGGHLFGDGSINRLIAGSVALGGVSSILDNVPLVAAALKIFPETKDIIWILLALTAGTGGSLLVIGSAAGVAAMGQVKELNFSYYFKTATVPALAGYIAGVIVWYGVYLFVG